MAIKIDTRELREILNLTPPAQNLLLVGRHGIGKSQIIREHFAAQGRRVVSFFLGQMSDPGDLIGLMHKDEKTGHSEFLPPWWWPLDGQPVVLFLDEMNRARPEILQSVMDLTLNRTLAGKKLPEGSSVISAVNEGEEYQLTDLDPALVSRFNVYHFHPTVQDWLIWADKNGLDERVVRFIQKNPSYLDGDSTSELYKDNFARSLSKTPDRRAWERVAHFTKPLREIEELHVKTIAGIVGIQAAAMFSKSLESLLKVTPEQLLLNWDKHKAHLKKMKMEELLYLNEQAVIWINGGHHEAFDKKTVLGNMDKYLLFLQSEKQNEALAHLASLLEDPKFGKVSAWLLVESPLAMRVLEEFVASIKL